MELLRKYLVLTLVHILFIFIIIVSCLGLRCKFHGCDISKNYTPGFALFAARTYLKCVFDFDNEI